MDIRQELEAWVTRHRDEHYIGFETRWSADPVDRVRLDGVFSSGELKEIVGILDREATNSSR